MSIAKPGVLWDANDAEGDVLTAALLTSPTKAEQFVLNEDSSFTYKPSVGSAGLDTFQYAVSDGQDYSAPKTVTTNIQIPGSVPSNESYVEAGDGSTVVFYDPLVGNTTVSLTFDQVTEAGTVIVTSVNNPGPPEGFRLGNPPVTYEIHTTAVFSGSIQVSFNYSGIRYRKESSLRLYHFQNGAWVDVTESVDTAQKVISGTVTTLSPFVIVEPNELPTAVITPLADCYEGITAILSASASSDPENDSLLFAWDLNNDHQFDDGTGVNALITPIDNGMYVVNLQVQDAWGGMDITQMEIAVSNVAPTIYIPPILPLAPVPITETITTTFYVKDSGAQDNLTAEWNWGEPIDPGLVESAGEAGVWKVSGAKRYSQPGIYPVSVTVSDKDGASCSFVQEGYTVIYDPEGNFVTGGGWLVPAAAWPAGWGRLEFAFSAKYVKNQTTPVGSVQVKVGGNELVSTALDWLAAGDNLAKFQGSGTLNGSGDYGFMITAQDNGKVGNVNMDGLRIQIWDNSTGTVVYDNKPQELDYSYGVEAIGNGSIQWHLPSSANATTPPEGGHSGGGKK